MLHLVKSCQDHDCCELNFKFIQGINSTLRYVAIHLREAILQKITQFYEVISQTMGEGSIGFHISYSEIVDTPKSVAKSEQGKHSARKPPKLIILLRFKTGSQAPICAS